MPLQFAPREAFQFDWSEDWVKINGISTKLQIAHFKLSYSRAYFMRAYMSQSHEMLFDAHYHAFTAFSGIPERGIYDNMKTAVDKVGRCKQRQVNKRFHTMVGHYLYETEFCNPAAGWEKGQVEKAVLDARHGLWYDTPPFKSLQELNNWLQAHCQALWREAAHPQLKNRSLADCLEDEQPKMMSVPAAFDGFVEHSKRVSSTCLITFEHNRYSVPASFANRVISLRIQLKERAIDAEPAAIGGCAGAAYAHPAFGEVVNGTVNLVLATELALYGDRRVHHRFGAAIIENQPIQFVLRHFLQSCAEQVGDKTLITLATVIGRDVDSSYTAALLQKIQSLGCSSADKYLCVAEIPG